DGGHRTDNLQSSSIPLGLINAIIGAGALIPILRELIDFSKVDKNVIEKIAEYIPSIKQAIKQ
ncbi:hypothetical protein, partial [Candidatus Kryptonium thompsonii]